MYNVIKYMTSIFNKYNNNIIIIIINICHSHIKKKKNNIKIIIFLINYIHIFKVISNNNIEMVKLFINYSTKNNIPLELNKINNIYLYI